MGNFFASIGSFIWGSYTAIAAWVLLIMLIMYVVPLVISLLMKPTDLKKKYNTNWVLVTGGSSGIGLALVEQIAEQGLNIVVVAYKDQLLADCENKLRKQFPKREFVFIGTDLSNDDPETGYMKTIRDKTDSLDIGVVFSNAGFIKIGAFANIDIATHVKHVECNVMSGLKISHHFFSLWKKNGRKGAISFTASSVGYFVAPYSSMYGATKSFMINFASSLAVEGKHNNIDVLCFNPQYTKTKLYDNAEKLGVLDIFALFGSEPKDVANTMLKAIGRISMCDQGLYSIGMRIVGGLLFDLNILIPIIAIAMKFAPEYKKLK